MPIPRIIYFCNKTLRGMPAAAAPWATLNPDYELRFYDDAMCEAFLATEYGPEYSDLFRWIKDGPIKADFWRLCMLYKWGGVYSDVDNVPLVSIASFLNPTVDFVTCTSYWDKMGFNFNPNFIISSAANPILKRCIDWYLTRPRNNYSYWDWSIMRAMTDTCHPTQFKKEAGIYSVDDQRIQLLKECAGKNHYDAHNTYDGIRIFNNRNASWDYTTHSFATVKHPMPLLMTQLARLIRK
jgi:hypothetical protein